MDATVGEDLDVAVGEKKIDEHAVVLLGVPYPQPREHFQRALARALAGEERVALEGRLDREADLAAVSGLALLDRLLDRRHGFGWKCAPPRARHAEDLAARVPDRERDRRDRAPILHGCSRDAVDRDHVGADLHGLAHVAVLDRDQLRGP